jgi:hypothetical protein
MSAFNFENMDWCLLRFDSSDVGYIPVGLITLAFINLEEHFTQNALNLTFISYVKVFSPFFLIHAAEIHFQVSCDIDLIRYRHAIEISLRIGLNSSQLFRLRPAMFVYFVDSAYEYVNKVIRRLICIVIM